MKLSIYQIDAFAEKPFEGNPAAVVPLEEWLPEKTMQAIALENNLSETAFFVPTENGYHIRWFTPKMEVKLCGHATLASGFVLFNLLGYGLDTITFDSLSGPLSVTKTAGLFTLDFPIQSPDRCETPDDLIKGLGRRPIECYGNEDYLAVFESESDIAAINPDSHFLGQLDRRGVIVTAPASGFDFVVRFFAPKYGILEDPVTGSAYTQLMPYWTGRTGRSRLRAKQISSRGGKVLCEIRDDRVLISGSAIKYLEGTIDVAFAPTDDSD